MSAIWPRHMLALLIQIAGKMAVLFWLYNSETKTGLSWLPEEKINKSDTTFAIPLAQRWKRDGGYMDSCSVFHTMTELNA